MKGFGVVLLVGLASAALAGCGGDNTTTFVLDSGSPTAAASASASAKASASASAAPATSTLPATAPTPIPGDPKTNRIIIDSPDAGASVGSPVQVSGTASVDKGTVIGVVLDVSGNELGRATATASASKPDYGHYDLTISFTGATSGTKGQLKVFGVSPRDGTTQTYWYAITVRFP